MKINTLRLDYDQEGETSVTIWADCDNPEDIQHVIDWLRLAKQFMSAWKNKRESTTNVVKLERKNRASERK